MSELFESFVSQRIAILLCVLLIPDFYITFFLYTPIFPYTFSTMLVPHFPSYYIDDFVFKKLKY